MCAYCFVFIRPSVQRRSGCVHLSVAVNNAAGDMGAASLLSSKVMPSLIL